MKGKVLGWLIGIIVAVIYEPFLKYPENRIKYLPLAVLLLAIQMPIKYLKKGNLKNEK
ncbi:hypothetical protein ES703_55920 [subsurface metagenome]